MTAPNPTPPPSSRASSLHHHFTTLSSPPLTTHLADVNSTPILSTHPDPTSRALSSLSQAFIQAHDTATRMKLGQPLRVTLSTFSGAAVIQTGIPGERYVRAVSPEEEYTVGGMGGVGVGGGVGEGGGERDMLVGTVIAPVDRMAEARMASWGVEDVARRFQKSAGERQ